MDTSPPSSCGLKVQNSRLDRARVASREPPSASITPQPPSPPPSIQPPPGVTNDSTPHASAHGHAHHSTINFRSSSSSNRERPSIVTRAAHASYPADRPATAQWVTPAQNMISCSRPHRSLLSKSSTSCWNLPRIEKDSGPGARHAPSSPDVVTPQPCVPELRCRISQHRWPCASQDKQCSAVADGRNERHYPMRLRSNVHSWSEVADRHDRRARKQCQRLAEVGGIARVRRPAG